MLSRQAGVNIAIADAALWDRRVPAIRGRMPAAAAVRLLARKAGAAAHPAGPVGWRLSLPPAPTPPHRPVPATDAAAPPAAPADIVVQASKRGMPARSMAGSVAVVPAMPIGIAAGTAALVARSTIISSTYRGSGREKLFVRGIADTGLSGRLQSVTGLYLGDVRLTYSVADPDLQLYDIASIEVLQGPQGTLYGSGSMAGIIRLNPNSPVPGVAEGAAGGGVSAVRHGAIGGDADAVVNLPLGADVAVRAVGYARSEGGFIDKPAVGRDVNRARIGGGRVAVRWWPAADWTVDAVAIAQTARVRDTQYATVGAGPLTSLTAAAEPFGSDYAAGHVVVTGRLGDIALVSATGVASQRLDEWSAYSHTRDTMVTHETRVSHTGASGTGWVAGIAYTDARNDMDVAYEIGTHTNFVPFAPIHTTASELAVFGEGTVPVTPVLSIGAGVRAVQIEMSADYWAYAIGRSVRRVRQRWLVPTVSAMLRPGHAWALYLRYQQGRRASVPAYFAPATADVDRAERIDEVEAGVRWTPVHGPRVTASVQRSRWNPVRIDLFEGLVPPATGTIGKGNILSANLTVDWPGTHRLSIDAAMTVNRTALAGWPGSADRLPDVADVVVRCGVQWSYPVGRDASVHVDGWARYEGVSEAVYGYTAVGRQGGYVRTGLTTELRRGNGTVTLGIENLLDTRGELYILTAPSAAYVAQTTPVQPRTIRIGLRRTF